jgi:hypothetical protein
MQRILYGLPRSAARLRKRRRRDDADGNARKQRMLERFCYVT